jgi:hypothetical protein
VPGIPYNAVFSFGGFSGQLTGISVEHGQPEVVNMTGGTMPQGQVLMVPTGDKSPGSITVDFFAGGSPPSTGTSGLLSFSSTAYSVSQRVILESVQIEARVGELVRGTMKFVMTDYQGS